MGDEKVPNITRIRFDK